MRPGRTSIAPPGIARRAPRITTGTTGISPRTAAANAPTWNRLSPGTASNVPSGKNTSARPDSATRNTRSASRRRPPSLWRSTNSEPMRFSRKPASGSEAASRLITKEKRGGRTAFMMMPSR